MEQRCLAKEATHGNLRIHVLKDFNNNLSSNHDLFSKILLEKDIQLVKIFECVLLQSV